MIRLAAKLLMLAVMAPVVSQAAEPVRLFAAGSLREPFQAISKAFEAREGVKVEVKFGASGLLRDEIAAGANADVFASADMQHPHSLSGPGKSSPVALFARNRLCALARPGLDVRTANVIERMLDPAMVLGTSTPKADPAGDYAWEVFRRIDAQRPGSFAVLADKARQLTGGPTSAAPPTDRSVYGAVLERREADLFLTYCTNARQAVAEVAGAHAVELPEAIAVGAEYGLTVMNHAPPAAYRFALFILSPEAQAILSRVGFSASSAANEGEKP